MAKSQITIHRCGFDSRPCDNYVCRRSKRADGTFMKKFYVGDPSATGHKPIFCEDCVTYLVNHVPPELLTGGADLESRLRAEITVEYNAKLEELVLAERAKLEGELTSLRATIQYLQNPPEEEEKPSTDTPPPLDNTVPDNGDDDDTEFRCLDCGKTFESARGLINHQRTHKAKE